MFSHSVWRLVLLYLYICSIAHRQIPCLCFSVAYVLHQKCLRTLCNGMCSEMLEYFVLSNMFRTLFLIRCFLMFDDNKIIIIDIIMTYK